ncbi:Hypothetical predicted protein [Mytilus galloprovincialis]|uniref:Uncharacterized protein n=1 Tax=Mytilus galloprovincialis TaxID=29158 RepID=A0A8B6HR68_MYTGA|nr:Hypothetical predicted protein [Mytilus galloprovincialis]
MEYAHYKRMQKLFQLCGKPALLKILDEYLKENMLSFSVLLDRHKHRVLHLYRLPSACCPNAINCKSPEKLPLVRNQWLILYDDTKNPHCNKVTCVCNVITNHVRASHLDFYILSLLMVTFVAGNSDVMPSIRGLHRECRLCEFMRPKKISNEAFETKWKNASEYLRKLGVTKKQIEEVRTMPVEDIPEYEQPETCQVKWRHRFLKCRIVAYILAVSFMVFAFVRQSFLFYSDKTNIRKSYSLIQKQNLI